MRPPGIRTNKDDYKQERIDVFLAEKIGGYDIVCLQELFAFGSGRRGDLIERARELGFLYSVASPLPYYGLGVDGGLVCLSKLEILAADAMTFTQATASDWLAAKGAIYAKIVVVPNKKHLHVFNTHLQASYNTQSQHSRDIAEAEKSKSVRKTQLIELCNFITSKTTNSIGNNYADETDEIVLVGDMNVDGRHDVEEYQQLIACLKRMVNYDFLDLHIAPAELLHDEAEVNDHFNNNYNNNYNSNNNNNNNYNNYNNHRNGNNDFEMLDNNDHRDNNHNNYKELNGPSHGTLGGKGIGNDGAVLVHPATCGVVRHYRGQAIPTEVVLTAPHENTADKCLDYIFVIRKKMNGNQIKWRRAAVQPFYVANRPFSQLSDHCGVSVNFTYMTNNNIDNGNDNSNNIKEKT